MKSLAMPQQWNWRWALVLALLVFASYSTVAAKGGWIWDDDFYVTNNQMLLPQTEDGLWKIWSDTSATPQYYPVVHTSFWLEFRLFPKELVQIPNPYAPGQFINTYELDPTGYHLTNILILALSVLAFWRVLLRLGVPGAWLAAALFAVHPVHVESVAWVTERKNMLSALFALCAVLGYLRFAGIGGRGGSWRVYALALLCWTLGLLSKTVIAFVPPALLLLIWWKRPSEWKRHGLALLPFFATGIVAGLHTAHLEVVQVGAGGSSFDLGLLERSLLAGKVVWVYLLHVLAPLEQMFFYPKWDPDPSSPLQWLLLAGAVALPLALLKMSRRIGRGPLVAILIFGGALFPVMGFVNVYPFRFSWVADHFQYHANFALFALLGALLVRVPLRGIARQAATALLLGALAMVTAVQGMVYQSAKTLWEDTIAVNPSCWSAYNNLGAILSREGDLNGAKELYRKGLEYHRDPNLLMSMAQVELVQGKQFRQTNLITSGLRFIDEALQKWPDDGRMNGVKLDLLVATGNPDPEQIVLHGERALNGTLFDQRFQQGFILQKVQAPPQATWARALFLGYLERGKQRLAAGQVAAALTDFQRSSRPVTGGDSPPWKDMFPWVRNTPWFEADLYAAWVLAASAEEGVRNPANALAQTQYLVQTLTQRLTAAQVPEAMQAPYALQVKDLEAACLAATGDYRRAEQVQGEVIKHAETIPEVSSAWTNGARDRLESYRAHRPYTFRGLPPVKLP